MENDDRILDWNDEIEKDGSDFVLLPEGDYDFKVTAFERARHEGSDKLPACPKAIVSLYIEAPNGESTTIKHSLFLHTKCEGMLSAFFCAIGQKKHGERLKMNWNNVIGATGRCKIYIDKFTKKDGTEGTSNKVKKFYDRESAAPGASVTAQAAQTPVSGVYTPGKF